MGTKLLMSTAFHLQTDGVTKQVNCSIRQVFRSVVKDDKNDWAEKSPIIEVALNSNVSTMTGFTPFKLNHSYMPRIDLPFNTDTGFYGSVMIFSTGSMKPDELTQCNHRASCDPGNSSQ